MKAIRILLQLVIVAAGVFVLAAIIAQPEPSIEAFIGSLGFMVLLLALTQMLKECTENRLNPMHTLSPRPMGIVFLLLGVVGIFFGLSYLVGDHALPDGSGSCRALCGLLLLTTQFFGETFARLVAFGVSSGMGLFLCVIGFKAVTRNR